MYCYFQHEIRPEKEAILPAQSRAAFYGDGCFDTLRADSGSILFFDRHWKRFVEAAEWLNLEIELSKGEALDIFQVLLRKNELLDQPAMIRLQAWRRGGRGYGTDQTQAQLLITAHPCPEFPSSVRLKTVEQRRIPKSAIPSQYKLSNGINYIVASRQAKSAGYDDAVMLTTQDLISETPIANLFWITADGLCTPAVECDLLPGITREFIMEFVAPEMGLSVQEVTIARTDLEQPDFVFTCNSLRGITPVAQWDDWHWSIENLSELHRFEAAFTDIRKRYQRPIDSGE
jgi:branched-subunit amino acid aminotransferase/4-amino-4-deoxychorismate lyase